MTVAHWTVSVRPPELLLALVQYQEDEASYILGIKELHFSMGTVFALILCCSISKQGEGSSRIPKLL